MHYFIGIDNGVSGSVCVMQPDGQISMHVPTPVFKALNYQKAKNWVNRVDTKKLRGLLCLYVSEGNTCTCLMERPLVNPGRFKATTSALRCLEATLIVLESLGIGVEFTDSRSWQKVLLPSGLEGPELKTAALAVVNRMFPARKLTDAGLADGVLIAEYFRRKHVG